jgi:hypothetical protein
VNIEKEPAPLTSFDMRTTLLRPDLSTGNTSAAHFALARRKLGRTGNTRHCGSELGKLFEAANLLMFFVTYI